MATNHSSFHKPQRPSRGITAALTHTACEFLLIFLLLIDGVFSYLVTKFARYCELQVPCLFCSRLDQVLGNEKPGFYKNLLCSNHRSEISSLISCNIHGNLVDGFGMCEDCLLSFFMKNNSMTDMHRPPFLGGYGPGGFPSLFLSREFVGSTATRLCLCCNKPWVPRQSCQRFVDLHSPGTDITKPNIPLPRRSWTGLKKMRDRFSGPAPTRHLGRNGSDPLPHAGYAKLRIDSEAEPEVPLSDVDVHASIVRDINEHTEESVVHRAPQISPKAISAQKIHPDLSKPRDVKCLSPDGQKADLAALPELISLDDIPTSRDVKFPLGVSTLSENHFVISDLMSLVDHPPSIDYKEVTVEAVPDKTPDVTVKSAEEKKFTEEDGETLKGISTVSRGHQGENNPAAVDSSIGETLDAKEKETSGFLAQQPQVKCNGGVNKDSRLSRVQDSPSQQIPSSFDNLSPALTTDESSHGGIQNLVTPFFVERACSSGFESLDESRVDDVEGESVVDKLNRQVEYDRKCINALYKELEEERNASAIAANQAMAMINRLQEEKAALHMEALQYLRMMEEQAEYDMDALEKANDLLAEKEKDIQDLETEIEFCRLYVIDNPLEGSIPEESAALKLEIPPVNNTSVPKGEEDAKVPEKPVSPEVSEGCDSPSIKSSWSDIADEKSYISERLINLEKKLMQFAKQRTMSHIPDFDIPKEAEKANGHPGELNDENAKAVTSHQKEDNNSSVEKDLTASNGSTQIHKGPDEVVGKENGHIVSNGENRFESCTPKDLVPLENEIIDLHDRLEALEADLDFLEHSINSLQSGSEGLKFIQDIAYQLQELRKVRIKRRCRPAS